MSISEKQEARRRYKEQERVDLKKEGIETPEDFTMESLIDRAERYEE